MSPSFWNSSKANKIVLISWVVFACLALTAIWFSSLTVEAGHIASKNRGVWADFAMHSSLIHFYLEQPLSVILSESPLLANANMPYPPLANALSTLLFSGGMDLYWALMLQSLLYSYLGLVGLALALTLLTRSAKAAVVASGLFLLNGGLGFIDAALGSQPLSTLMANAQLTNHPGRGLAFANVIATIWQPQRSFLAALPFVAMYFALFYAIVLPEYKPRKGHYLAIACMALIAFLAQAHSLIVLFIFSCTVVGLNWRKHHLKLIKSGLLTALLVSPWAIYLLAFGTGDLNLRWAFSEGPLGQERNFFAYLLLNWSHILILIALIWWKRPQGCHHLLVLGAVFFVVGHLVIFQPWGFDNLKILIWAYFFWSGAIALWLLSLWRSSTKAKVLALASAMVLCLSGFLDVVGQTLANPIPMVSPHLLQQAELVRNSTPRDAVILTQDFLYSPVTFAGRKRLCAYEGWLWSYGLDYSGQCQFKQEFFRLRDVYPKANQYGVTHFISQTSKPTFADPDFRYTTVIAEPDFFLYRILSPGRDEVE